MVYNLKSIFLIILLFSISNLTFGQKMTGKISEVDLINRIGNVIIQNVNSQEIVVTDSTGHFVINTKEDDLIEFRKIGYRTIRIRATKKMAPFYNIQLPLDNIQLKGVDIVGLNKNFKLDSIKQAEIYNIELNHFQLDGIQMMEHPLEMLSKKNQQIWRFQKNYQIWQSDKFVDFMFSDKLITKLTSLNEKDSMNTYRRLYRPHYEQLRIWSDYEFGVYIKETVADFRRTVRSN